MNSKTLINQKDWDIELRQTLNSYNKGSVFTKKKALNACELFLNERIKQFGLTEELNYKLNKLKEIKNKQ